MLADLHTHSEHSHDSVCKIEDMLLAQRKKGTAIFAVTDHFDTESHLRYDVFTPIRTAYETVEALNKKYGDITVLSGIEISEGYWFPEIYERVHALVDYDVIIGSVHIVRFEELDYAYSKIDFSALPTETVEAYTDAYFDDVLTLLEEIDFDILAHLTCPLRYINGKYHRGLTLERYQAKITKILQKTIDKGISLEVNTSSYDTLGDFMPGEKILEQYYKMGGRRITLGSDAHTPACAAQHFDAAVAALKEIGFTEICYYQKRIPHSIKI